MNKIEIQITYSKLFHQSIYECFKGDGLRLFGIDYEIIDFDVSRDKTIINFKCIEKPS